MTKFYRFKIDLRQVDSLNPATPAAVGDQVSELSPELAQLHAQEAVIMALGPARVDPADWTDPLEGEELAEVYNASLRRAQQMEVGAYREGSLDYNVFFDEWGNKHVITRSAHRPESRVGELMLSPAGVVLRLAYEHVSGPAEDTTDLFRTGLSDLEEDPTRLFRSRGYVLRTTRLDRQDDRLVRFQQKVQQFDPQTGQVVSRSLA